MAYLRRKAVARTVSLAVLALLVLAAAASGASTCKNGQNREGVEVAKIPQGPSASPDPAPLGRPGDWQMVFREAFAGNSLDASRWTTCYPWYDPASGCTNDGNDELQWYLPDGISVSDDTLKLTVQKRSVLGTNGRTYNYTSGMITTGPSGGMPATFAYQYGFVEAKIKLPAGKGYHGAFWTLPTDMSWPPEIDVMEHWGDPHVVTMNVHSNGEGDSEHEQDMSYFAGPDLTSDFHVYGMYWSPQEMVWYVDGVEVKRLTDPSRIPSKPMYLILNLAVEGNNPPDATTSFPGTLEVAYVRAWQR